ncbi:MAG: sigma-70 family RNA polymerase sigma factor [Phycisphaerae bacterium]|nr:sigma-70 family RNA polymerase sigma factor [Phycisphaerae bacterium]
MQFLKKFKKSKTSSYSRAVHFTATRWSVVLAAGGEHDATDTRRALEELIRAYWFPLYAFLRRRGEPAEKAEDLVQGFLTRLLEKRDLSAVDRAKGRFRSFLLASLKHYLSNEYDKARAKKRGGGGANVIALEALDAEARYAVEPADDMTPERLFDRQWAMEVLQMVLSRLQEEYAQAGKAKLFETIKDCLTPQRSRLTYADYAQRLGMSPGALKTAIHRMRKRYREILHDEIAQTVETPGQVEEEIAYLRNCL